MKMNSDSVVSVRQHHTTVHGCSDFHNDKEVPASKMAYVTNVTLLSFKKLPVLGLQYSIS